MAVSITVTIDDRATPLLRGLPRDFSPEKVHPVIGRAGVNVIRKHLFKLDRDRPNELGGRRTHFYGRAARSTNFSSDKKGVNLSINHQGMAQRFFGGRIKAVNSKFLTIPANRKAHGRRAKEFDDLEVAFGKSGPVALVQRRQTTLRKTKKGKFVKGKQTGGKVFYWLKESVNQKADPSVIPTLLKLTDGIEQRVLSYMDRQLKRKRNVRTGK